MLEYASSVDCLLIIVLINNTIWDVIVFMSNFGVRVLLLVDDSTRSRSFAFRVGSIFENKIGEDSIFENKIEKRVYKVIPLFIILVIVLVLYLN